MTARFAIFVLLLAAASLAGPASAARFTADKIAFEDVTGAVEIVTTGGDEIEVVIAQGKVYRQVMLSEKDGVVTVKGERWIDDRPDDCCNTRIRRSVELRKDRKMSTGAPVDEDLFADYPTIKVTMPRKGDVSFVDARIKLRMDAIDGALSLDACYVYGETGDVGEAVIGIISGSRLVVGDVGAGLEVDVSGDADLLTGDAAMADIDIAGSGDVMIGEVGGMLDVSIAGSGRVRAMRLEGPLTARIAGSGAVSVKAGRAEKLKAFIDGSGGVYFDGTAIQPELRLAGSAEVRMGAMSGRLTHVGGGSVYVGDKLVEKE